MGKATTRFAPASMPMTPSSDHEIDKHQERAATKWEPKRDDPSAVPRIGSVAAVSERVARRRIGESPRPIASYHVSGVTNKVGLLVELCGSLGVTSR
jgi:hypothetical protein